MIDKDSAARKKTLVEEGTHFKGSLSSDCPVEVKGRIEGDLTAPALAVSPSGAVHGHIKVGELRSEGELAGEFDADVVQLSGTVKDNTVIRTKSLEVKLAPANGKLQVVFGECELEVGADQAQKKEPAAALKPASVRPTAEGASKMESLPPAANGA
ncbi:MAG TPA: polymer-forming cytoskeletal protein [Polyangiaceae bacterium]|jgi:cytoskeletal protein CcmA (bactofilin family)